jgi:hypothetical protein
MDRRPWWRIRIFLLGVGLIVTTSACTYTVGCTSYTLSPPPDVQFTVDESACAPPPAIPEVPSVLLLPLLGLGVVLVGRKVTRAR